MNVKFEFKSFKSNITNKRIQYDDGDGNGARKLGREPAQTEG